MPSNFAAWIASPYASPLVVKSAPEPCLGPKDVVVQTAFVAINPLEYKIQDYNPVIGGRKLRYPTIIGSDLAGTIVSVGSEVTLCKVGDRVMANAPGMNAFQNFVALPESSITLVPENMSLKAAVVLPLACDTAMAGLFVQDQLGLSTTCLGDSESSPRPSNWVLLVWGGSSSVGCCATQMAVAAGYEVYAVASTRNHTLCSLLGASRVFDYANDKVEDAIVRALEEKTVVGALDCISDSERTIPACARILAQTNGQKKLVTVLAPRDTVFTKDIEVRRRKLLCIEWPRFSTCQAKENAQ